MTGKRYFNYGAESFILFCFGLLFFVPLLILMAYLILPFIDRPFAPWLLGVPYLLAFLFATVGGARLLRKCWVSLDDRMIEISEQAPSLVAWNEIEWTDFGNPQKPHALVKLVGRDQLRQWRLSRPLRILIKSKITQEEVSTDFLSLSNSVTIYPCDRIYFWGLTTIGISLIVLINPFLPITEVDPGLHILPALLVLPGLYYLTGGQNPIYLTSKGIVMNQFHVPYTDIQKVELRKSRPYRDEVVLTVREKEVPVFCEKHAVPLLLDKVGTSAKFADVPPDSDSDVRREAD